MQAGQYVGIAVIVIFIVLYIAWKIKEKGLKGTAIEFIVEAEKRFNSGDEKMNYCIEKIAMLVPLPFQIFVTGDMIKKLIQAVFDNIKVALDYRPIHPEKEANKYISGEAETNVKESEGTD